MSVAAHHNDPTELLEATFTDVWQEEFAGLPIINPRLKVEARGFALAAYGWTGMLITPWCMNLVILPAAELPWESLEVGKRRTLQFAGGAFEMLGGSQPPLDEYLYCSLFSPMHAFADHANAQATADEALRLIHAAETLEVVRALNPTGLAWHAAPTEKTGVKKVSRRAFLRGKVRDEG